MDKVGRNEPCPCGSGKKYKRCCESADRIQPASRTPDAQSKPTGTPTPAQVPPAGLPGQQQHLITLFRFSPSSDPRNQIGPQGIFGDYTVTFVLERRGYNLLPERQYSFATGLQGNSHLAITRPAFTPPGSPDATEIRIDARTEDGNFTFRGLPNASGFLGKIESTPFKANSFSDAEAKAHRALASSLSNWSVHLDIPFNIYQIDSTHVLSGNTRMSMSTAYWEVPFAVTPIVELKPEFRGYASLYREALSTNSEVYAYLCLFKIIEGVLTRRHRLDKEAKSAGTPIKRTRSVYRRNLRTEFLG